MAGMVNWYMMFARLTTYVVSAKVNWCMLPAKVSRYVVSANINQYMMSAINCYIQMATCCMSSVTVFGYLRTDRQVASFGGWPSCKNGYGLAAFYIIVNPLVISVSVFFSAVAWHWLVSRVMSSLVPTAIASAEDCTPLNEQCGMNELKNLTDNTKIDIITIQETKLKPTHRTPYLKDYTAIRTDRTYKNGGGLMTYIKNDIIFTELKTPHTTNHKLTELQHIKIHLANHKHLNIFNIYIPPRDTTNPDHSNSQEDITNCMTYILNTNNTILTGDFNAHHTLWHSPTTDNRGTLIADLINSSNQIVLNTNTPTRIPTNRNQQATSPDISTASNTIYNNITWSTLNALNSDHNPIKISYNTKTKFRLIQHRRSYTNYRKADWQGFTNSIENTLTDTTDITDVHKSNKILTLLLLDADKHYIPKGKIRPNNPLLPENIRAQIKEWDIIKANDPTDNRLEHLNKDISQAIQTHRSGIW